VKKIDLPTPPDDVPEDVKQELRDRLEE